ncbi:N-acetylmuramic acid 6-phosphate etherase [Mucilaginibacter sp. RS28]|uniref:N-acetylmuramic acid 6-phosphate etherase n=1 Tax=Mucilaginibacter straminoryzae TaxID=2932774 RepID=A0A9X1X155_9SPHI|nr:N-acetylmuramic acid 6-phosphate etherase [Mucilaginibacter straminoryzae]MCJ8209244.1 N-acetylmuramic acid 6-phosphate etherase [Mucilaginibacter straminoryzae]
MEATTEKDSRYSDLHKMSITDIVTNINNEDKTVPLAVEKCIPQISALAGVISEKMKAGGRLFYIGAGTSGRLGILDASEVPPTFGVSHDWVIGIIAGGDTAIRKAVEFAEDDQEQAWKDLQEYHISNKDVLVGIAASGNTPYVLGGLAAANWHGLETGCVVCNSGSPIGKEAKYPVEVVVGPEFLTGSTRMKAGTAQKLVLNMLTTSVMISLGRVKGNKMVDMQLTNHKLYNRGVNIIMQETGCDKETAARLLEQHGSVRQALTALQSKQY